MQVNYFRPLVANNLWSEGDEYKLNNIDQPQPQSQSQPIEDKTGETVSVASDNDGGTSSSRDYAVGNDSPKRDALESEYESDIGGGGEDVPFQFQFPPHPSKWLDDIDTSATTSCGAFKCFFPSRTNRQRLDEHRRRIHSSNINSTRTRTQQQPTTTPYGYLVSEYVSKKSDDQWVAILDGWTLAKELSKNFSIRHYLRAAPEKLQCDKDCMRILLGASPRSHGGDKMRNHPLQRASKNAKKNKSRKMAASTTLIVQPLEVASSDAILFGFSYSNRNTDAMDTMKELFSSRDSTLFSPLSGSKLMEFEKRLRFDFNATVAALMDNSTGGHCLRKDFQVMVDPHTGSIYHLDFDRCFEHKPMKFCPPGLQAFAGALLSQRSGGAINSTDFDDPAWHFPDCVTWNSGRGNKEQ
jgi:hypothetical protein